MKKIVLFFVLILMTSSVFTQTYSVTFQVDMNVQKSYGVFDPSLSDVILRGSFNDWSDQEAMIDDDNDGIYILTKDIAAGSIAYKFFYKNVQGQDVWEEIPDRTAEVAADTTLPVVYFLNDAGSKTLIDVYFSVNMEIEIGAARFDAGTDNITVRGNFNGWGDSDTLYSESLNPFIYSKIVKYLASAGDVIHYKFNVNGEGWEIDFPDNDGGHRLIEITQAEIDSKFAFDSFTYPNQFFNGFDISQLTQQSLDIKFVVDMNNAADLNGMAFSSLENVFLCGNASPLFWAWDSENRDKAVFLTDDGTNGDELAGDNFWTSILTFPKFTTTNPFNYKYGANYDLASNNGLNDNENYPGEDHWIKLDQSMVSATMRNVFGAATTIDAPHPLEDVVSDVKQNEINPIDFQLFQNYPNPFNPTTNIKFSIAKNSDVTLKLYDILGNEIALLVNGNFASGSYDFQFDASRLNTQLSSGIYLVRLTTNDFSSTIKIMLLK